MGVGYRGGALSPNPGFLLVNLELAGGRARLEMIVGSGFSNTVLVLSLLLSLFFL